MNYKPVTRSQRTMCVYIHIHIHTQTHLQNSHGYHEEQKNYEKVEDRPSMSCGHELIGLIQQAQSPFPSRKASRLRPSQLHPGTRTGSWQWGCAIGSNGPKRGLGTHHVTPSGQYGRLGRAGSTEPSRGPIETGGGQLGLSKATLSGPTGPRGGGVQRSQSEPQSP